jgi:hypothetical protein
MAFEMLWMMQMAKDLKEATKRHHHIKKAAVALTQTYTQEWIQFWFLFSTYLG